jgi:hypothetical protein
VRRVRRALACAACGLRARPGHVVSVFVLAALAPCLCVVGAGYKYQLAPVDFYIWTFIYDFSGVSSVQLMYRQDADGVNPLNDTNNEV